MMRLAGVLTALALALAACGGDDGSDLPPFASAGGGPSVPSGFSAYAGEDHSFAHPTGYTKATKPDPAGAGGTMVEFSGRGKWADLPPQVAVGREKAQPDLDFEAALEYHRSVKRQFMPQYEVTSERRVRLTGARLAHVIESRYVAELSTGESVPVKGMDLILLTEDGKVQMNFFVRGPEEEFGPQRLGDAFKTFRLK